MHCSCMAGLGEAYTHVAVFSFSLKYILKFAHKRDAIPMYSGQTVQTSERIRYVIYQKPKEED